MMYVLFKMIITPNCSWVANWPSHYVLKSIYVLVIYLLVITHMNFMYFYFTISQFLCNFLCRDFSYPSWCRYPRNFILHKFSNHFNLKLLLGLRWVCFAFLFYFVPLLLLLWFLLQVQFCIFALLLLFELIYYLSFVLRDS